MCTGNYKIVKCANLCVFDCNVCRQVLILVRMSSITQKRRVVPFDGLWLGRFPAAVLETAKLSEPFGKDTVLTVQCVTERVVWVIHYQ